MKVTDSLGNSATATVTVSAGEKNGRPFVAVEDSGVGIPAEERQRVRQRFYRMPNSPGHGSGLGLSIVYGIIQRHDGTIRLESEINQGTRITLILPNIPAETAEPEREEDRLVKVLELLLVVLR